MIRTVMDVVSLLKPQKSKDPEFVFDTKGDIFDILAHVTLTAFIDDQAAAIKELQTQQKILFIIAGLLLVLQF